MTEIPEHLLKRAQERLAALAGEAPPADAPAAEGAPAAAATAAPATGVAKPAAAAAARTAPAPAPPPKPDPPYVAAAKNRKKVPYWAAPVLALLVPWAYLYWNSVQPPPASGNDPLTIGQTVFTGNCAACHGTTGGGGTGPKLADGEVLKTFKDPFAMAHWIAFGAEGGARPNGTYGDLTRPGGPHNLSTFPAAMPAWRTSLTPEEIAAVVLYVREGLSGAKPDAPTEKLFNPTVFDTLADKITAVIALGPTGDPKLTKIESGK